MISKVLSVLAAIVVMIVAGFLLRSQRQRQQRLEELNNDLLDDLDKAVIDFSILTGKEPLEYTIESLEQDMEILNRRLRSISIREESHSHEMRSRYVKRKKNSRNY